MAARPPVRPPLHGISGHGSPRALANAGRLIRAWSPLLPGLWLCLAIALVASALARLLPIIGASVIAIALGVLARLALELPARQAPGVRFASKRFLQAGIVGLGAGLSLGQVWRSGSSSLAVLLGTLVAGVGVMLLLGRLLRIDRTLARLIAVGTGICGASAIGALAPVLAADEAQIAYAISTVFAFNIAAVLLFPALGHLLGLSQHGFGLWSGTAINDTSSVVAAAYSYGASAGAYAVVVKLTRSVMIVPVCLLFAAVVARERGSNGSAGVGRTAGIPAFIVLFLLASALHTIGIIGTTAAHALSGTGQFLIVVALAGVGLSADLRAMRRTGFQPLLLGLIGWVGVASLSLVLQHLTNLR